MEKIAGNKYQSCEVSISQLVKVTSSKISTIFGTLPEDNKYSEKWIHFLRNGEL